MKKTYFILALVAIFNSGCHDDLEELPYNIFSDESIQLFTFVGHTVTPGNGNLSTVEIDFTSIYNELPAVQQARIEGIQVYRNGGIIPDIPAASTKLITSTVNKICYQLAFIGERDELSRMSEEYCVEP